MSDVIVGSLLILSGFALLIFARWLIDAINEDHAKKYSCTFNPETEEFETTNHKEERTMSEDTPEYIESNTNKKLRKQLATMRETVLDELIKDFQYRMNGYSNEDNETWKWLKQKRAELEKE